VRPVRLLLSAAILAASLACASSRGPLPTLSDYTQGASSWAARVEDLFRAEEAERFFSPRDNRSLVEAARQWRGTAAGDAFVEARVTDFPRKPGLEAAMAVRVELTAHARSGAAGERLYAAETFELELRRAAAGAQWELAGSRPRGGLPTIRRGVPHLTEISSRIGLSGFRHRTLDPAEDTNICLPATHHHPGVVLADFDGDGSIDIVVPGRPSRLFLNDGTGRFRDATAGSGLDRLPAADTAGGASADLDGDGLPELLLTSPYVPIRLLHNDGGGHFHEATAGAGLSGLAGTFTSAVFFDADGDGRLDLFLANYGDARETGPAYSGKNGPGNRFFHNVEKEGRPFFVDETEAAGFGDRGWGFAASACDYDGDGRDDLYVANDFGANCLYRNESTPGHPRFRDVARQACVRDEGYGMGVAWGDYDGDGRFDLHVSDFSSPYRWMIRSPRLPMPEEVPGFVQAVARPIVVPMLLRRCQGDGLYRNEGGGRFERTSESAGVAQGDWAWGTEFADLDGDGRLDLLVVNGMWEALAGGHDDEVAFWNGMSSQGIAFHDGFWGGIDFGRNGMGSRTAKHLYANLGDGRFEERAYLEGFDTRDDARGLAVGDLDGDGAPDIVVGVFHGPLLVYHNGWTQARRITLRLRGSQPHNRDAVGAVVRLTAGGQTQVREVRAGSSYLSQSAMELYFGLGGASRAEEIEVRWPDGRREARRDVSAGSRLAWAEGETRAAR
jgi:hypothetical protein